MPPPLLLQTSNTTILSEMGNTAGHLNVDMGRPDSDQLRPNVSHMRPVQNSPAGGQILGRHFTVNSSGNVNIRRFPLVW